MDKAESDKLLTDKLLTMCKDAIDEAIEKQRKIHELEMLSPYKSELVKKIEGQIDGLKREQEGHVPYSRGWYSYNLSLFEWITFKSLITEEPTTEEKP